MDIEGKTLIIIELKNNKTEFINSHENVDMLMKRINEANFSVGIGLKDVDGSWIIINQQEFVSIKFIPQDEDED